MLILAILFSLCSCKKQDLNLNGILPLDQVTGIVDNTLTTIIPGLTLSPADTLVPANAVNVKKYGAKGDGITDDTKAIQAAINAETVITLSKGTFIINKTLEMRSGVKIYAATGATLKGGSSITGTLLTNGRYINFTNDDNCLINNLTFAQASKAYKLSAWYNSVIFVNHSKNIEIKYNTFSFTLPYNRSGLMGVWVSGEGSSDNLVKGNTMNNVGIEYCEDGASNTTVDGNTIKHAPHCGIVGHGNTPTYCTGNVIVNNIIENSGTMGIEDWGNIDGTIIRNNIITGTGKNAATKVDGMGISVVGVNARVVGNKITDAQTYYIEAASNRNQYIDSNIINDVEGRAIGIIVNVRDSLAARSANNGSIVCNNTITGTDMAISIFGDNVHHSVVKNNTIKNPGAKGIYIDSAAPTYDLDILNNNISFTTPNSRYRRAIESYTNLEPNTSNQNLTIDNNVITYSSSASGGSGVETGIMLNTDNTTVSNNIVNGNDITAGGSKVWGISGNIAKIFNLTLINNTITGAIVDLNDFSMKTQSGNNF